MSPLEKMSKKENRFYESFVKDDMRQLEAELQVQINPMRAVFRGGVVTALLRAPLGTAPAYGRGTAN